MEPNQNKKPNGALIGSIIVILIIVLGGVYFWASKQKAEAPDSEKMETKDTMQKEGANDSTSQELNSLEMELGQQQSSTELNVDVNNVQ